MIVLGYCKLTSKQGNQMAKVQCCRDYTPEEIARVNAASGSCIEDVWLFGPLIDKITPSCVGKEINIIGSWKNGRMVVSDVLFK